MAGELCVVNEKNCSSQEFFIRLNNAVQCSTSPTLPDRRLRSNQRMSQYETVLHNLAHHTLHKCEIISFVSSGQEAKPVFSLHNNRANKVVSIEYVKKLMNKFQLILRCNLVMEVFGNPTKNVKFHSKRTLSASIPFPRVAFYEKQPDLW